MNLTPKSATQSDVDLINYIDDDFSPSIRERGREYYLMDRVKLEFQDGHTFDFFVQGDREYEVSIELDRDRGVGSYCECPYFQRGEMCKHVYACFLYLNDILDLSGGRAKTNSQWANQLARMGTLDDHAAPPPPSIEAQPDLEVEFVILNRERVFTQLLIEIVHRTRLKSGEMGARKTQRIPLKTVSQLQNVEQKQVLLSLAAHQVDVRSHHHWDVEPAVQADASLEIGRFGFLIPQLCETRVFGFPREVGEGVTSLTFDPTPWHARIEIESNDSGTMMKSVLTREGETASLRTARCIIAHQWIVFGSTISPLNCENNLGAALAGLMDGDLQIPKEEESEFVKQLSELSLFSKLELPEAITPEIDSEGLQPALKFTTINPTSKGQLECVLEFQYGDWRVSPGDKKFQNFDTKAGKLYIRNAAAEKEALRQLDTLNIKLRSQWSRNLYYFRAREIGAIFAQLAAWGWLITIKGKTIQRSSNIDIQVNSGIDWLGVSGGVNFGETTLSLPEILNRRQTGGDNMIILDDGTVGVLPEEWLKRYERLLRLGKVDEDQITYQDSQAAVIDLLLEDLPDVQLDERFLKIREELRSFKDIKPVKPLKSFKGELRGYQGEGLAWLQFLQRFGFGGCLADDMGLGKTVQVLAQLQGVYSGKKKSTRPTLIVAPSSVVHNWQLEAQKFTPKLKTVCYVGSDRQALRDDLEKYQLIMTSYGILRRDITFLKDLAFEYAVLDEAQAIKNHGTQAAKASRLIQASHRLALSGTPVENQIGDLWSIFEFLNPGMLGASSAFQQFSGSDNQEARAQLARALGPYILRRSKKQVATDLPDKVEETVYCKLSDQEMKTYNELRDYYRSSLNTKIKANGMNRSKVIILEALLRLRQAACHPGLIDADRADESSAKLDLLLTRIEEVVSKGHKALVFSQFVSLLTIVRKRLDKTKTRYAYLDGRTRKREERVREFQEDPDCRLFLISLKAGGVGLNLTAADYVFILDPWWNPAVEAQAIDRAYRIGQTKNVFAYRVIAEDTIEQKVLELQDKKRNLAESIINQDGSLLKNLQAEDLELLLS